MKHHNHYFEERAVHKHTNTAFEEGGNIILNKGLCMFLDKYSCQVLQVPRAWYIYSTNNYVITLLENFPIKKLWNI